MACLRSEEWSERLESATSVDSAELQHRMAMPAQVKASDGSTEPGKALWGG